MTAIERKIADVCHTFYPSTPLGCLFLDHGACSHKCNSWKILQPGTVTCKLNFISTLHEQPNFNDLINIIDEESARFTFSLITRSELFVQNQTEKLFTLRTDGKIVRILLFYVDFHRKSRIHCLNFNIIIRSGKNAHTKNYFAIK